MNQETIMTRLQQLRVLVDELIDALKRKGQTGKKESVSHRQRRPIATPISFESGVLAFMSKHTRGLNGAQKFTLLLARLAKGSTTAEVSYKEIEKRWNKMKTVTGGEINAVYANRARAKGWVDTKKHGVYHLCEPWKDSLQANERVVR